MNANPFSQEALDAVPELRALARKEASALGLPPGSVLIGGDTGEAYDTRTAGNRDSLVVLPLILVAIGFGVAVGVLIDTFITRTLIAPALVSLLGRWNWWEPLLRRDWQQFAPLRHQAMLLRRTLLS